MKKIILAFDGPDNVGKGTQVDKVRKWLKDIPFVILHVRGPVGESSEEKVSYGSEMERNYFIARKSLWDNNIPQINDRAHFSEYAYRMFRDSDEIEDILEIEKEFKELKDDYLIFTFVDREENIAGRDDGLSMYSANELEKIKMLVDRFKFISEKSLFENYIIDIDGKGENEVFEIIKEKIKNKFNL